MMDWHSLPVFQELTLAERGRLHALATEKTILAGQVLVYQGDPTTQVYLLLAGDYDLYQNGQYQHTSPPTPHLIAETATLGGLFHPFKIVAKTDCRFWVWEAAQLWDSAEFAAAARRYLAQSLQKASTRVQALSNPLSYNQPLLGADLPSGAFLFENTTMIFAFCEAKREAILPFLPPDLSLLMRPFRQTAPILVALADFTHATREDGRGKPFAYTETTFFIPVRHQTALGFYVPFIYPSTYEPILLGREIYGFPKRLGETEFESKQVSLRVDRQLMLNLNWEGAEASNETRLVGALGAWLGSEATLTAAAFQAGEVLRKVARLPAHRRVDVYNHKKIPAADTSPDQPRYEVNQLTRCSFGVLRWYQITALQSIQLSIPHPALAELDLTIQSAYRTQLDMRLSVGRMVKDYLHA